MFCVGSWPAFYSSHYFIPLPFLTNRFLIILMWPLSSCSSRPFFLCCELALHFLFRCPVLTFFFIILPVLVTFTLFNNVFFDFILGIFSFFFRNETHLGMNISQTI